MDREISDLKTRVKQLREDLQLDIHWVSRQVLEAEIKNSFKEYKHLLYKKNVDQYYDSLEKLSSTNLEITEEDLAESQKSFQKRLKQINEEFPC